MAENKNKAEKEAFIKEQMEKNDWAYRTAEQLWRVLKSNTAIDRVTRELMEEGLPFSTAKYQARKIARGQTVRKMQKSKGLKVEEVRDIFLIPDPDRECGFVILKRNNAGLLNELKAFEDNSRHWMVNVRKGRKIAIASILWVQINQKDIPAGYCIDHMDGNPKNNDLSNLSLITLDENRRLRTRGNHKGE